MSEIVDSRPMTKAQILWFDWAIGVSETEFASNKCFTDEDKTEIGGHFTELRKTIRRLAEASP